jgi:uncharacterized protein (DUF433 family)
MALPTERHVWPRRIVRDPKILGGEPSLEGTRVPVRSVVLAARYEADLDAVVQAYPMLDRVAVESALAFYRLHRDEIDRHIAENEDPVS